EGGEGIMSIIKCLEVGPPEGPLNRLNTPVNVAYIPAQVAQLAQHTVHLMFHVVEGC
ncbi:hypothetical protein NDU88_000097, partial [Pleurodeles waltl]